MEKKSVKNSTKRPGRSGKKRKFHGNRYTNQHRSDHTIIMPDTKEDPNVSQSKLSQTKEKFTSAEIIAVVIRSANFAAIKHTKQRRKDIEETPYINHPLGVADILIQEGDVYDPVVIAAALLHDTVEDTDTTIEEIEREFGRKVSNVVAEVTDDKNLPKAERKLLQIKHTPHISFEAKLVKLADKIYNLRDLQKSTPIGWTSERVEEYFEWSKAVIDGCRGSNSKLETAVDLIFAEQSKKKHCKAANTDCIGIVSKTV